MTRAPRDIGALLLRYRRNARQRTARTIDLRGVADDEDFRMARHGQVRPDQHSPAARRFDAEPIGRWRWRDACGPDQGAAFDALVAEHRTIFVAAGHPGSEP
jgi:hypothetical protein